MTESRRLTGATFCSGIGTPEIACPAIDWRLASEIESFPRRVLQHRFGAQDLRYGIYGEAHALWGDLTTIRMRHFRRFGIPLPNIVVAGLPCQAFSIAGLRASLDDARGNLTLQFLRTLHGFRAAGSLRNFLFENVPGILSTEDNAFGCLLAGLVGADDAVLPPGGGRKWPDSGMVSGPLGRAAWTILDAQHFGLAQRRRRVFLVADFGSGADPVSVLFERRGLSGYSPSSREERKDAAAAVARSVALRGRDGGSAAELGDGGDKAHVLAPKVQVSHEVANTLTASGCGVERAGDSRGQDSVVAMRGTGGGEATITEPTFSIQDWALRQNVTSGPNGVGAQEGLAYTIEARSRPQIVDHDLWPAASMSASGNSQINAIACDVADTITVGANQTTGFTGDVVACREPNVSSPQAFGGNNTSGQIHVATARNAHAVPHGRLDFESETFLVERRQDEEATQRVDHSLRGEGFDASEDGSGRGTPILPVQIAPPLSRCDATREGSSQDYETTTMVAVGPAIAFSSKDHGGDATEELSPTIRTGNHSGSHANAGTPPAVAFNARQDPISSEELSQPLDTDGTTIGNADSGWRVRRLTPLECERLQGLPDNWTRIPVRRFNEPRITALRTADLWEKIDGQWWLMAADGPRYKAIGNGMAKDVVAWILDRIVRFQP